MAINREAWLDKAVKLLDTKLFKPNDLVVPPVKASVGWPSHGALSPRSQTIGQCFYPAMTRDKVTQIFISPVLDKPADVLAVLVHEMLHAALPVGTGHKSAFAKGMVKVGLTGKPTATVAGKQLKLDMKAIATRLGAFPHGKITVGLQPKQSTRLLKAQCEDCGYTVRVTAKWLNEAGEPICPTDMVGMAASF